MKKAPDDCGIGVPPANQNPVSNAGPDQTLTLATGQTELVVTLDGSASSDADGTIVTFHWSGIPDPDDVVKPLVSLGEGTHNFFLLVEDDQGAMSTDMVTITVNAAPPINQIPVADAGPDQTLTLAAGQTQISVTLDGSGSSDADGSIDDYNWSGSPNPDNVVMPQIDLGVGVHTFTLVVEDEQGAMSLADQVTITVNAAPPVNQMPVADAGPDQTLTLAVGQTQIAVTLDGSGSSDPDGTVDAYQWSGTPDPTDVVSPQLSLGAGSHTFSLIVTDDQGLVSLADTVTITVNAAPGDHHAGLSFANYQGSASCFACHTEETREAHAAVHYQWQGDTPHAFYRDASGVLINLGGGGKLGAINDFCGYPDINFIGQLITVDGEVGNGGCAQCHAGMGDKPDADPEAFLADGIRMQRDNVDCLLCHSGSYKRKVASVTQGDGVERFAFVPDGDIIPGGLNQAITDIRSRPSIASCVSCHAYAGGGCNSKRGDIQTTLIYPPDRFFDVHMASTAIGGAGLDCLDCHFSQEHKIAGSGIDLRPVDLNTANAVRCTNCHETKPHHESTIDKHTARVDCRSCHIPTFAKADGPGATDVFRDYSQAPVLNPETRLFEPFQLMQSEVQPVLQFDNGDSEFYRFLDSIHPQANDKTLMAGSLGSITDPGVMLIPVKHHLAVQPHDPVTGALLPLKMGILFTGRLGGTLLPEDEIVNQAILKGVAEIPELLHITAREHYDFVDTERYMGISHEVTTANRALDCDDCHTEETPRIDFDALGYTPLPARTPGVADNCGSGCHEDLSDEWAPQDFFEKVHQKHVTDKKLNCSECHGFSTAVAQ